MFIKDCTILYTATVGAAPFFSACSNKQTCFAGADFQEICSKTHLGYGLCCHHCAMPLQVWLTGPGIQALQVRQQPQRPKTPAISNRNAFRCTSTVWAIIMHSGILFLIYLIRHSTTSKFKSRKFTQVRVEETNIQSLLCFAANPIICPVSNNEAKVQASIQ